MPHQSNLYASDAFLAWARREATSISRAAEASGCAPSELPDFLLLHQAEFPVVPYAGSPCPKPTDRAWLAPLPETALRSAANAWSSGKRPKAPGLPAIARAAQANLGALVGVYACATPHLLLDPIIGATIVEPQWNESKTRWDPDILALAAFARQPDATMALLPYWEAGLAGPRAELFALSAAEAHALASRSFATVDDRFSGTASVALALARLEALARIRMSERAALLAADALASRMAPEPAERRGGRFRG